MNDHNHRIHMIKTDGSLWNGPAYLETEMKKLSWRTVINPKRSYYPEYDQTAPGYTPQNNSEVKESHILEVEVL